jgi:hypothetical protein
VGSLAARVAVGRFSNEFAVFCLRALKRCLSRAD